MGIEEQFAALLALFETDADGAHRADFCGKRLRSAFQPILSISDGALRIDGHEALLRPTDFVTGAPADVEAFFHNVPCSEVFALEQVCRILHVRNFLRGADHRGRLYLNISPMAYTDIVGSNAFVERLPARLRSIGLRPDQIVLEIVETAHQDKAVLLEVVSMFHEMGVSIAIDDFGAFHSNFDRIFDFGPDIVKFDRQWLARAREGARGVRFLAGMVRLMRDIDVEVCCEGIETELELRIAMDAGFDLFQGYHLGRPRPIPEFPEVDVPQYVVAAAKQA